MIVSLVAVTGLVLGGLCLVIGREIGRRAERREQLRLAQERYDALGDTLDEVTLPRKWRQPAAYRWN